MQDDDARDAVSGWATAHRSAGALVSLAVLCVLLVAPVRAAGATTGGDAAGLPQLPAGQQLLDTTGRSFSAAERAAVDEQVDDLAALGVAAVVVVRELDATPEETLDQVEELHAAFAAATATDPAEVAAVLVNREPGADDEARTGVFVGGDVEGLGIDEDERIAIVEDALLPALRVGDVAGGVLAALDRIEGTMQFGPPRSAFQVWAAGAVGAVTLGLVLVSAALVAAGAVLWRRRATSDVVVGAPTTRRPGDLPPGVAGALVRGGPADAHTLPATLLELARLWAVALESAVEPGDDDAGVRVRLVDGVEPGSDPARALLGRLREHADDGVVGPEALQQVVADPRSVHRAVEEEIRRRGWTDPGAARRRGLLAALAVVALLLLLAGVAVAVAAASVWPGLLAVLAPLAAAATVATMAARTSGFSVQGQQARARWQAYRDGLRAAGSGAQGAGPSDVAALLPDIVAFGLAAVWEAELANHPAALGALAAGGPGATTGQPVTSFPVLFGALASTSAAGGGAIATSAGVAGGGGAAGGT